MIELINKPIDLDSFSKEIWTYRHIHCKNRPIMFTVNKFFKDNPELDYILKAIGPVRLCREIKQRHIWKRGLK